MSAYELLGILVGAVAALATVGGIAWRVGKASKGEAALQTYKELADAQGQQIADLKGQHKDQQREIDGLKKELEVLREQVLQRARVEELAEATAAGFKDLGARLDDNCSTILGQLAELRRRAS